MTATAGGAVEQAVTDSFAAGRYAYSLLLDAAGTQAVEQIADEVEREIGRLAGRMGLIPRWRFSPGYGDWPLAAQREIASLAGCGRIGIVLTESLMLRPRKSITAVVGLGSRAEDGEKIIAAMIAVSGTVPPGGADRSDGSPEGQLFRQICLFLSIIMQSFREAPCNFPNDCIIIN